MKLGMIGLGRMGGNMVRRLIGLECCARPNGWLCFACYPCYQRL
jgi:pyrroline-5-carboxylate reductase